MNATVMTGTDGNFSSLVSNHPGPALVAFVASWSGPCRLTNAAMQTVANESDSRVQFVKVDIDLCVQVADRHNLETIPAAILFVNGREVARLPDAKKADQLRALLKEHVA